MDCQISNYWFSGINYFGSFNFDYSFFFAWRTQKYWFAHPCPRPSRKDRLTKAFRYVSQTTFLIFCRQPPRVFFLDDSSFLVDNLNLVWSSRRFLIILLWRTEGELWTSCQEKMLSLAVDEKFCFLLKNLKNNAWLTYRNDN